MNTVTVTRNPNTASAYQNVPLGGGGNTYNTYLNGVTGVNNLTGLVFITGAGDTVVSVAGQTISVFTAAAGVATSGLISTGNADLRYYPLNNNISGYALGNSVVYKTGDQNISGIKTFETGIRVSGNGIDFINTINPVYSEGRTFYDKTDMSLSYYNDNSGFHVKIAQQEIARVINNHGSIISGGQPVYIDGSQGNKPTVKLAIASNTIADKVLGIAATDISNNQNGYVITRGVIKNINTSAFSAGDSLYLSPFNSGQLINYEPEQPSFIIKMGTVLNAHQNQGSIYLNVLEINHDLGHLYDVYIRTGNLQHADLLMYDNNSGLWINRRNFSGILQTGIALTGSNLQNQINNINSGTGNFSTITYVQTGFVPKLRYNSFSAPAGSFAPLASGGATATSFSITNTHYLDAYSFDAASEQGITLQFSLPDTYNNGSLKSKLFWGVASGGISGVVFSVSARAYVSGNTLNQPFGPETLISGYASASGIVFQNTSNIINLTGFVSGSNSLVLMKISRKVSDAGDVCSKAALLYNANIQWQETGVEPSIWS